jgi:hypothetical protein
MTWYEDLAEIVDEPKTLASYSRAVGWLERSKPYAMGIVDREVFDKLKIMAANLWYPPLPQPAGSHECELCLYEGKYGKLELFIPGNGFLYVCPILITHYMNEHGYAPPEEFCEAVLACPPFHTMKYMKAFLSNGGRELIQASHHQAESLEVFRES